MIALGGLIAGLDRRYRRKRPIAVNGDDMIESVANEKVCCFCAPSAFCCAQRFSFKGLDRDPTELPFILVGEPFLNFSASAFSFLFRFSARSTANAQQGRSDR